MRSEVSEQQQRHRREAAIKQKRFCHCSLYSSLVVVIIKLQLIIVHFVTKRKFSRASKRKLQQFKATETDLLGHWPPVDTLNFKLLAAF